MEKFTGSASLLIGAMALPENFNFVDAVVTDKFPVGAILLRNKFGIYCLWHGGSISMCDQREAARYVADSRSMETAAGLIPISLYASIHGLSPATVRQKCIRGGWRTAVKIGRDWFIDPDEPHTDRRKKAPQNEKD